MTNFLFLVCKITVDGDCSYDLRRRLLIGRKAITNLDCVLKSRDITLPTKVHIVRPMVFPVVMYSFESWTVKKVECRRIDAFELWCWRRLLRVPQCMKVKSESEVAQSCPTPSDPMDSSLPGSSVHGIFQARVLEWAAIAFSACTARRSNQSILKEINPEYSLEGLMLK